MRFGIVLVLLKIVVMIYNLINVIVKVMNIWEKSYGFFYFFDML